MSMTKAQRRDLHKKFRAAQSLSPCCGSTREKRGGVFICSNCGSVLREGIHVKETERPWDGGAAIGSGKRILPTNKE